MWGRRLRTALVLTMAAVLVSAIGAAAPTTASAATHCKQYDQFRSEAGSRSNVRVCAAPASDFPNYSGWGRVETEFSPNPSPCDFSLLPYDIDDPAPALACLAVMPQPVPAWRWTGNAWKQELAEGFTPGSAVYFAPYATGWHWAWTARTGWLAIQSSHAAYRWYA